MNVIFKVPRLISNFRHPQQPSDHKENYPNYFGDFHQWSCHEVYQMFPAPVAAASAMNLTTAFVIVAPQKSPVAGFHILLAPV
jgi:hypothetical protein